MLDQLSLDLFSAQVGETFRIVIEEDNAVDVELIEAKALPAYASPAAEDDPQHAPFTLLFRGPKEVYLPQRLYTLTHPTLGTLEIFLVPIQPDQHGSQFEAVFN